MCKKAAEWLKTPGGVTACSIFAMTSALILLDVFIFQTEVKSYTSGIITEFIGIVVTVAFVQFLFDKKNEKDSKTFEENAILRSNIVLQRYLKRYTDLFYCVTTPISERNIAEATMKDSFTFKDMRDLHKLSMLITEPMFQSSIDRFFIVELSIRNHMISMINNINFKHYPNISEILLNFIDISIAGDVRDVLSNTDKVMFGDEKATDVAHKTLSENADALYADIKNGKDIHANFAHPYIFLYEMMNSERDLINEYVRIVDSIKNK